MTDGNSRVEKRSAVELRFSRRCAKQNYFLRLCLSAKRLMVLAMWPCIPVEKGDPRQLVNNQYHITRCTFTLLESSAFAFGN